MSPHTCDVFSLLSIQVSWERFNRKIHYRQQSATIAPVVGSNHSKVLLCAFLSTGPLPPLARRPNTSTRRTPTQENGCVKCVLLVEIAWVLSRRTTFVQCLVGGDVQPPICLGMIHFGICLKSVRVLHAWVHPTKHWKGCIRSVPKVHHSRSLIWHCEIPTKVVRKS